MDGIKNYMEVRLCAISENESLARMLVGAFMMPCNPTMEELEDVKTAVCEAVTNYIIHGYENKGGEIRLLFHLLEGAVYIEIEDEGVGMENVEKAMEPLYTTKPELERSGMGFTFMEAFMDEIKVHSKVGKGTKIQMRKKLEKMITGV